MESHIVKIIATKDVTHDVKCFRVERPANYQFVPGQATEVAVHKPGWENENRPFTFTSLNDAPWLEFTIKRYAEHEGVTDQLHQLSPGDELILHDVWGAIAYNGPGYFIAGGAGITPFIAILRDLKRQGKISENTLFFSNKTPADIIYEEELKEMLGHGAHFILTRDKSHRDAGIRINREFLLAQKLDLNKHFYVCGPDQMVQEISGLLADLGAPSESLVFEK
jgi:ferredoxin-NADP reductase